MQVPLVISLIGKDRPGLVEAIAALVAEQEGNWLESRMSHLGGQFAGILRIHVTPENEAGLIQALHTFKGLSIVVHQDTDPEGEAVDPENSGHLARLEIVGHDRPGIVREISRILAAHQVNVEEMDSERSSAPMSGELLFKARAEVRIPQTTNLPELKAHLEKIAADLLVELTFSVDS